MPPGAAQASSTRMPGLGRQRAARSAATRGSWAPRRRDLKAAVAAMSTRAVEHDRRRHRRVAVERRRRPPAARPRRARGRRRARAARPRRGSLPVSIRARAIVGAVGVEPQLRRSSRGTSDAAPRRRRSRRAARRAGRAPLRATRRRIAFTSPAAPGAARRAHEVDRRGDRRVRRHAVGVEQLVGAEPERVADRRLELGRLAAAERRETWSSVRRRCTVPSASRDANARSRASSLKRGRPPPPARGRRTRRPPRRGRARSARRAGPTSAGPRRRAERPASSAQQLAGGHRALAAGWMRLDLEGAVGEADQRRPSSAATSPGAERRRPPARRARRRSRSPPSSSAAPMCGASARTRRSASADRLCRIEQPVVGGQLVRVGDALGGLRRRRELAGRGAGERRRERRRAELERALHHVAGVVARADRRTARMRRDRPGVELLDDRHHGGRRRRRRRPGSRARPARRRASAAAPTGAGSPTATRRAARPGSSWP